MRLRVLLMVAILASGCGPFVFVHDRGPLRTQLYHEYPFIPQGAIDAFIAAAPQGVLYPTLENRIDGRISLRLNYIELAQERGETDTTTSTGEFLMTCNDWRHVAYYAIVCDTGAWYVPWDTLLNCEHVNFALDTVYLGIESDERPSLLLNWPSVLGSERKYLPLARSGTAARPLFAEPISGAWFERCDVDSDGILEVNLPRRADSGATYWERTISRDSVTVWVDRVFVYDSTTGQFSSDRKAIWPAQPGTLTFDVSLPADTFLTHEIIWFSIETTNHSRISFPGEELLISTWELDLFLKDSTSTPIPVLNLINCGGPSIVEPPDLMKPGEAKHLTEWLNWRLPEKDSGSFDGYLPPGRYSLEFAWNYDRDSQGIFNGRRLVGDTVQFVIVNPDSSELRAQNEWREILQSRVACPETYQSVRWDFYRNHLQSVYRISALTQAATGGTDIGTDCSSGVEERLEYASELAYLMPEHQASAYCLLRMNARYRYVPEVHSLLQELADSVPDTRAGREAARILAERRVGESIL